jgi:hypothetical protein
VLGFDLWVMLAVALACLPVFMTGREIARWEGGVFLAYYVAYVAYLVLAAQQHAALGWFSTVMLGFVVPLTVITLVVVLLRPRRQAASPARLGRHRAGAAPPWPADWPTPAPVMNRNSVISSSCTPKPPRPADADTCWPPAAPSRRPAWWPWSAHAAACRNRGSAPCRWRPTSANTPPITSSTATISLHPQRQFHHVVSSSLLDHVAAAEVARQRHRRHEAQHGDDQRRLEQQGRLLAQPSRTTSATVLMYSVSSASSGR